MHGIGRRADLESIVRRVISLLPWAAMAAAAAVLSTAAFSLAGSSPPPTDVEEVAEALPLIADDPLVVPDIRRQPYVFAKGLLEDAGFSWRVKGQVRGYPANVVAEQTPAPGTLVVDTGAPTLVIKLENNENYEKRGLAKDTSPYKGTKLILWDDKDEAVEAAIAPVEPQPSESTDESAAPESEPEAQTSERPPAFVEPGAEPEPLDEITLTKRAKRLAARLAGQEQTPNLVDHWLYEHNWIVTGAEFGWYQGEEALVLLIAIDDDLQARWGIGAKSAALARESLAVVQKKTAESNQ